MVDDVIAVRAPEESNQAVQVLFDETTALFHCLQAIAASVHMQGNLTAGLRGVLLGLEQGGPQTVPQMARLRPTSRQHIQVLVNRLRRLGLVLLEENPDHLRSRLVRLTADGERTVALIREREARLLALAAVPLGAAEVGSAAATLRAVRAALTESRFRRIVEQLGQPTSGAQHD